MIRILRCATGLVVATTCFSCVATSSMGKAVVSDVNGLPCFSVPANSATQSGVPLDALGVTKMKGKKEVGYPTEVWYFRITPPGETMLVHPKDCILYGQVPKTAQQEEFEPLQSYQVYSVFMQAVPKDSNLQGYRAEFCVTASESGKKKVLVVPWDESARKWQYEVCAKP
jgi:hypothetical protein